MSPGGERAAESSLVRTATERGIRTITLDSPANRNALSARLRAGLVDALAAAGDDEDVRAVVLTAAGPVFCAGADLKEAAAEREGAVPEPPGAPGIPDVLAAVMGLPKPVVARLNGPVRAGGVGLVAAADIAIAPESATFACTEVRLGLVPAVISVPAAARMSNRHLSRYFLTGETFGAAEAARAGLVTAAVPDGEVEAETERVLESLRGCAPAALARTKALLAESAHADGPAAELTRMGRMSAEFFAGEDAEEGRSAFFGKRPPRWAL